MASLYSPPIHRLPKEILSLILLHAKLTSSTAFLAQCLLCCKGWHDLTLPLLYHDVLLTNSNLESFGKTFDVTRGPLVCSLTMTIDPVQPTFPEDREHISQHGSQQSKDLWFWLQFSLGKIASMTTLVTFSLNVSTRPKAIGFWIPRPLIMEFVRVLPNTCANLEIDTRGNDYYRPGDGHLCDALRKIFPQLRHLRLRLSTICPAILGDGFNPTQSGNSLLNFEPVAAPRLETLNVNCIPLTISGSQAHICGTFQENAYSSYSTNLPEARIAIVDALCLAKGNSSFPAAKCLQVLHALPHSNNDRSIYASLNRRNVLEDVTWALPFRNFTGIQMDSFLIRTPEGREFLSWPWAIEALAEGELWSEAVNGFRVPTPLSIKNASVYVQKKLPLLDTEAWKVANPRKSCTLWLNEEVSGTRLLNAECSQGVSVMISVKEKTPAGWTRDG